VATYSSKLSFVAILVAGTITPALLIKRSNLLNLALKLLLKSSTDTLSHKSNCMKKTFSFRVDSLIFYYAFCPLNISLQPKITVHFNFDNSNAVS
jgi:hypothetical protein